MAISIVSPNNEWRQGVTRQGANAVLLNSSVTVIPPYPGPSDDSATNSLHRGPAGEINREGKSGNNPPPAHRIDQVKLYADLNMAALKSKQSKELALWYCLRHLNISGSGAIRLELAIEGLVSEFNYSRNTLFRHLKKGEGLFWQRIVGKWGSRIEIYALSRVYEYFGITRKADSHPRMIKVSQFSTVKNRSAQIYATIFKPDGIRDNPVSRGTISDMTGLHKAQQRRREKTARVKRTPNYAVIATRNHHGRIIRVKPERIIVEAKSRQYLVNKRLGNTYHSQAVSGHRGMLRKVKVTVRGKGSSVTGEAPLMRRYFSSLKQLLQALKRKSKGVYRPALQMLPNSQRLLRGRLEWVIVDV